MTVSSFLSRHAEALEHLLSYRTESEHGAEEAARTALSSFTIALSREAGTPALEVARQVGDRLDWPVYDREVTARIAHELHLPVAAVENVDERRQSWLLECLEALSAHRELSESRYFVHLISVIRSLGEKGRCVIIGRGAAFVLPPRSTLRVRLIGNRAGRIAGGTAAHQFRDVNRERNRFLREHFHVDPNQPCNYDLIVNTSQWSVSECADFILRALHHKAHLAE